MNKINSLLIKAIKLIVSIQNNNHILFDRFIKISFDRVVQELISMESVIGYRVTPLTKDKIKI